MREKIIGSLDSIKDQAEDVWAKSCSIKNSLRLLGICLQESQHESFKEMGAITEIYFLLSEVLEKKTENIIQELDVVLADIKQESLNL